jgi:hypothetical protein
MSSTCHSTLKVDGNAAFAESIREIVTAVFGPCVDDKGLTAHGSARGCPVAVVQIESAEVPPSELVRELSDKLPELSFVLAYAIPSRGCRGSCTYHGGHAEDGGDESSGGESLRQEPADATLGESGREAGSADAGAANCTQTPAKAYPRSLRERAQEHLEHGYSFIFPVNGYSWKDGFEEQEAFRKYEIIRAMLSQEEKHELDELKNDRKARADSLFKQMNAVELLLKGLYQFEIPEVAKHLDAEDRAALGRLMDACGKVGPECYVALVGEDEREPF